MSVVCCVDISVFVTGRAGFMSSHIFDRLLSDDSKVTMIDNFRTGRLENVANHQGGKDFHACMGGGEF